MAKKVSALCCLVNPKTECQICDRKICEDHMSVWVWNLCRSTRCKGTHERKAAKERKEAKEREERMDRRHRSDPLTPDTSSRGYHLLKKIEAKKK